MNTTSVSPKTYVINSGKGTVYSTGYQIFKYGAKAFGFYKDIKPYLPEEAIQKYRTKAIKTGKYKYSTFLAGASFQKSRSRRIPSRPRAKTCGFNKECTLS